MRKNIPAVAAALATAAIVTACGPTYQQGPDGIVTGRVGTYTKHYGWRYRLTVTTAAGTHKRFRVSREDFRHCFHQSHYPACTKR
jgi:hypothetical protein